MKLIGRVPIAIGIHVWIEFSRTSVSMFYLGSTSSMILSFEVSLVSSVWSALHLPRGAPKIIPRLSTIGRTGGTVHMPNRQAARMGSEKKIEGKRKRKLQGKQTQHYIRQGLSISMSLRRACGVLRTSLGGVPQMPCKGLAVIPRAVGLSV